MNKSRPRDKEAWIRLSDLRRRVGEGGGKGERSTKGLVCIHMSLTSGQGQQGVGNCVGRGLRWERRDENKYVIP